MIEKHGFSDDEWEVLLYVPFAVFLAVGWADGKLAPAESNTFALIAKNVGVQATRPQDALVRDVLREVGAEFGPIAKRMDARLGTGLTLEAILQAGRQLLETKADTTQGAVFKNTMVALAEGVANASPLLGPKLSPEENLSIQKIKGHLGVSDPGDAFLPFKS